MVGLDLATSAPAESPIKTRGSGSCFAEAGDETGYCYLHSERLGEQTSACFRVEICRCFSRKMKPTECESVERGPDERPEQERCYIRGYANAKRPLRVYTTNTHSPAQTRPHLFRLPDLQNTLQGPEPVALYSGASRRLELSPSRRYRKPGPIRHRP